MIMSIWFKPVATESTQTLIILLLHKSSQCRLNNNNADHEATKNYTDNNHIIIKCRTNTLLMSFL